MLLKLRRIVLPAVAAMLCLAAPARAAFHQWVFAEAFTSVDGSVQFIRMHCPATATGEVFMSGNTITCSNIGGTITHSFTFPSNLSGSTGDKELLIATSNFAALNGGVAPDYIIPAGFLFPAGGNLIFANGINTWNYGALPTDGSHSLLRSGATQVNTPKNFRGTAGSVNVPAGACCVGGSCSATIQSTCTGTWTIGVACGANTCAPATGACCAASGACSVSTASACTSAGGTPMAPGTTCPPNPCPQPTIACCAPDGGCTSLTAAACASGGGVAQSFPSVCNPNPCPQPPGVCCAGCTCRLDLASNCMGPNTIFLGGSMCNAGSDLTPCCRADYNHSGEKNVTDIFAFLTDWFSQSLRADFVGNGTTMPQVNSIFGFLSAWFAGGC